MDSDGKFYLCMAGLIFGFVLAGVSILTSFGAKKLEARKTEAPFVTALRICTDIERDREACFRSIAAVYQGRQ